MTMLIWPLINFSVLLVILGVSMKKPLVLFVEQRHFQLSKDLSEAKALLAQAQKDKQELEMKMKGLEAERTEMRDRLQQEVNQVVRRATESAERLSASAVKDARLQAEQLMGDFKREILFEMSKKIVERAEFLIRQKITQEDSVRMTKELSRELG